MPYDGYGMPQIDFSALGNLPRDYREAQAYGNRQRLLSEYGGDLSLAQLAEQKRQHDAQMQNMQAQRALQERQIRLQEESAREAPKIEFHEDASGNKVPYRIGPRGSSLEQVTPTGAPSQPTNPFSPGKQTESQSKDSGYASRMFNAESILRDPKVLQAATSSGDRASAAIAEKVPFGLANRFVHEDFQKFDQAQRDFINANLRRESGAVINESEFVNARKQYFPQPGDSPAVIAQKQKNRVEAIRGIAGGGGPNYRPPFTFGPQGELVPNAPQGGAGAAPKVDVQKSLENARNSIKSGKDPEFIKRKLKENGIDPGQL